jgi:hypothetical protein
MWVTNAREAALSIITGGGKWVEIKIAADPLYQHLLLTAEKKFWRCVESGEPPHLFTVEPPRPRIEAIRIVDMSSSNSWAEFAALFRNTRGAFLDHERAKAELKTLIPEDAKEAIGHGVRAALPREERELMIAANNGHVLAFDNLSSLPGWLSDALCRLASGGSFALRQLYTDADEVLFQATRPATINAPVCTAFGFHMVVLYQKITLLGVVFQFSLEVMISAKGL